MERPIFVAQYTFLAIPETFEEENRILCKVALRCEYVIRFEDDGNSISFSKPVPITNGSLRLTGGISSARLISTKG